MTGITSLTCGCKIGMLSTGTNTADCRKVYLETCEAHAEDARLAEQGLADYMQLLGLDG